MKRAVENLQQALSLLELHQRDQDPWLQSAKNHVVDALAMLEPHPDRREPRTSAIELLLKAELALASMDFSRADPSYRMADQLLLEARARLEAMDAEETR